MLQKLQKNSCRCICQICALLFLMLLLNIKAFSVKPAMYHNTELSFCGETWTTDIIMYTNPSFATLTSPSEKVEITYYNYTGQTDIPCEGCQWLTFPTKPPGGVAGTVAILVKGYVCQTCNAKTDNGNKLIAGWSTYLAYDNDGSWCREAPGPGPCEAKFKCASGFMGEGFAYKCTKGGWRLAGKDCNLQECVVGAERYTACEDSCSYLTQTCGSNGKWSTILVGCPSVTGPGGGEVVAGSL